MPSYPARIPGASSEAKTETTANDLNGCSALGPTGDRRGMDRATDAADRSGTN